METLRDIIHDIRWMRIGPTRSIEQIDNLLAGELASQAAEQLEKSQVVDNSVVTEEEALLLFRWRLEMEGRRRSWVVIEDNYVQNLKRRINAAKDDDEYIFGDVIGRLSAELRRAEHLCGPVGVMAYKVWKKDRGEAWA